MLTKNIRLKNFNNKSKLKEIIKIFNNLKKDFIPTKKTIYSSLQSSYQYTYDKKIIKKYKKFSNFRISFC